MKHSNTMENPNQTNYQTPETSHKSLSCICCSCGDEDKGIVARQSNSAIRCKCWESNTPPRPPEAWRQTFDQLVRQWSNQTQNRGSEDHIQPYFPSPGEVRIMFGQSNINGIPEYAAGYTLRDPQEWRPDAYEAPSINQQAEDWARWERATLHVSVKSFDPVTGSHFSLGSTWNPGASPVFGNMARNTSPQLKSETDELDNKRANVESLLRRSSLSKNEKQDVISAFLNNTVLDPSDRVEATTAMLRRSTATYDEKKRTLFSALKANADKLDKKRSIARAVINALIPDSKTQSATFIQIFSKTKSEDPELGSDSYSQIMNEVMMLTKGREIENDQTRADVESLVRTSPLNSSEKIKIIDRLLKKNILDPNLRKVLAESMIRRCIMINDERRANIISILQDADIAPSSKAEFIAIILEEDSQRGNEFDDNYNIDAQNVSGTAIPASGYTTSVQNSDNFIRAVDSSGQNIRAGTSKTNYGNVESLRSIRDQVSKASIKPSRSQIERSQMSAMNNTNIPPHLLESLTSQGQQSGELYSTTNMNQPSKYSNLDFQGQSTSQMIGSQRDLQGDISKTGNVESLRNMRDLISTASFKPSRCQLDGSQMSGMDNTSIPPQLLESLTSQGQHSGELYSTTNMKQPSKYSNLDLQGQSASQMYGSQRDLKGDISKTGNVESLRSMNEGQISTASFKPSRSQMARCQTSAIDNSCIPPQLLESLTSQGQHSGELYSTTNMDQPSKYSNLDFQGQSTSQMIGSQRDLKGDISKTGNVESLRSMRDQISTASFKPSRSQMARCQTSAIDNSCIPPQLLESLTSQGQHSGELYSTTNMDQPSKYSNLDFQGQSTSQMIGSQRDLKGDISKTGNVESLRSMRDQISTASFKQSRSQMDRCQTSAIDNSCIPPQLLESLTSQGQHSGELYSTTNMDQPSKYSNLDFQGQSTSQMYGSQRDLKGDISKTTYTDNVESLRSVRDQVSKASVKPSRSQMDKSQMSAMDNSIIPPHSLDSQVTQGQDSGELSSSSNMTQKSKYSNLDIQGQSASQMQGSTKNIKNASKTTFNGIMESLRSIRDQVSKAYVRPSNIQIDKSQASVMDNTSIPPHVDSSMSQVQTSGQLSSSSNMNQNSKYSNLDVQGQSASQIYGSRRDIKGDVSKTTYNGNMESLRSIKEQQSESSVKPSHSQIDRDEMSATNQFNESHGTASIISHHLPVDNIRSSTTLDDDEKLIDLEVQAQCLPKKSVLCSKCSYIKTCGCTKLNTN